MKAMSVFSALALVAVFLLPSAAAQNDGLQVEKNKNPQLKQFPDLVIIHGAYDKAKPGVRFRVENRGKAASTACKVKLFAVKLKGMIILEELEFTNDVPALAAGAGYSKGFTLPKTQAEVVTFPTKMVVDSENVVKEYKEDNNEWAFAPKQQIRAEVAAPRDDAPAFSLFSSARGVFSAHRRSRPAKETIECPATLRAEIGNAPAGWDKFGAVTLNFEDVKFEKPGGKPTISCYYSLQESRGLGFAIFRQLPPTYGCGPGAHKRQMICGSIIKAPGK